MSTEQSHEDLRTTVARRLMDGQEPAPFAFVDADRVLAAVREAVAADPGLLAELGLEPFLDSDVTSDGATVFRVRPS